MSRLYIFSGFIFCVAVVIQQVVEWRLTQDDQTELVNQEVLPEFIAESLSSKVYNKEGKLSYVIKADRMEHYTDLGVTNFEHPQYNLYPKDSQSTWKVSAKEGILYKNNRVLLENRVRIISDDPASLVQEVHGKYLELDLNSNILSSEQTILIQGKSFNMYGSGLIVDLNTDQMTLTEHVQTIYKQITP